LRFDVINVTGWEIGRGPNLQHLFSLSAVEGQGHIFAKSTLESLSRGLRLRSG
jgi:hypothetical protein